MVEKLRPANSSTASVLAVLAKVVERERREGVLGEDVKLLPKLLKKPPFFSGVCSGDLKMVESSVTGRAGGGAAVAIWLSPVNPMDWVRE